MKFLKTLALGAAAVCGVLGFIWGIHALFMLVYKLPVSLFGALGVLGLLYLVGFLIQEVSDT
jgi:hypothetical protein